MKTHRKAQSKAASPASGPKSGPKQGKKSRRNAIVLISLLGSLVGTSVLLLALAPAPLLPEVGSLSAADEQDDFDVIFQTARPIPLNQWQYIYIHHTRARRGNAYEAGGIGDHFLIGNGEGCTDGGVQIAHRWNNQQPAILGSALPSNCISIAVVGDFNARPPTANQVRSLRRLVASLQRQLNIPARSVATDDRRADSAGVGKHFPTADFRSTLIP